MPRVLYPLVALLGVAAVGCGRHSSPRSRTSQSGSDFPSASVDADRGSGVPPYSGTNPRGVPRYFRGHLTPEAQAILREAFGVVSSSHVYISDSTEDGLLKYDPTVKRCASCYVNSYRLGFVSVRNDRESWDDLERRVRTMHRGSFRPSSLITSTSITAMDPDIQQNVVQMLKDARRNGFDLHVVSTYRSPEQEALLMSAGGGRTHTLTSLHSYGRAIDLRVGDGKLGNPGTRKRWIAFRAWVTRYRGDTFRILGAPDKSWDWPHVELPSERIGFRSIDAAVAAGRECLSKHAAHACEFRPHLPQAITELLSSPTPPIS